MCVLSAANDVFDLGDLHSSQLNDEPQSNYFPLVLVLQRLPTPGVL
jgi:hypothetical protein